MLAIKNLSKNYGSKTILNNVSLTAKKGEVVLLLGSSGVGKSTLLRILAGLETASAGDIECDGKVGMVFQQFNLFENMTAQHNITFALEKVAGKTRSEAQKIALTLLEKYNLFDKKDHYPEDLSGGQKQRLAIARTVARKPHIICMDEPTSALDPLLTTSVANAINELAEENYIVVVATHDIALIQKVDCTIYLMEHGVIVETAESRYFNENPDAFEKIKQFVQS